MGAEKVFKGVGQKWHTILPIRDMLISPGIQSSSTFILSFQSVKPKTRCIIQMTDIALITTILSVNISQTILAPALVPRFQLTQVQHLHSVSNRFEALSVLLGLLSAVHLFVSFLASKLTFQYASMWSLQGKCLEYSKNYIYRISGIPAVLRALW